MIHARLTASLLLAGMAGLALAAGIADAQNYPTRAVRLIIPFSAGGAADVPGRILTQRLTESLGQRSWWTTGRAQAP